MRTEALEGVFGRATPAGLAVKPAVCVAQEVRPGYLNRLSGLTRIAATDKIQQNKIINILLIEACLLDLPRSPLQMKSDQQTISQHSI